MPNGDLVTLSFFTTKTCLSPSAEHLFSLQKEKIFVRSFLKKEHVVWFEVSGKQSAPNLCPVCISF